MIKDDFNNVDILYHFKEKFMQDRNIMLNKTLFKNKKGISENLGIDILKIWSKHKVAKMQANV